MNLNLDNYIKVYNRLSLSFCDNIVEELEKSSWEKHSFYVNSEGNYYSTDTDFKVTWNPLKVQEILHQAVWDSLYQYVVQDINFSWFHGWQQFTGVRFNRYETNTEMHNHCDHIHDIFDGENKGVPVLSVLGILNDDFEGGDLIFFEDKKIETKKGDIIVFPSNFLFPHKVSPVTKNVRYSFVSWAW